MSPDRPIIVGVSKCLLGEHVRYDGAHKKNEYIVETLGRYFEWRPVCPEVEFGMGVPRETIRLEDKGRGVRLIVQSGSDITDEMKAFSEKRARAFADDDLCGFILKKDSPSCGLMRVKVYDKNGSPARRGQGAFAEALVREFPHLPIEEEGRLSDPKLRENFIERVFAYRRLKDLFSGRWTVGQLVAFHSAEKLLLLSHRPTSYQELGRLVAGAKGIERTALRERYIAGFMEAMAVHATPGRHVNVLEHMAGYFKKDIDARDKAELAQVIDDYRRGLVPLVVPLTLVRHYVHRFEIQYLKGQRYLEPSPKELMLRNHV